MVAGHGLQDEEGLNILGLIAATREDPEFNARMIAGWRAFHCNKVHLFTSRLPKGIRWKRWTHFWGPVLSP